MCPDFKQISQPSFPSASLVCQANVINISMTMNTNWVLRYHRAELWSRNSIQDRKHAMEGCPYHHLKKLLRNREWYCYRSIRMEAVPWVTWEAYKRTSRTRNMSQIYLKTPLIQDLVPYTLISLEVARIFVSIKLGQKLQNFPFLLQGTIIFHF